MLRLLGFFLCFGLLFAQTPLRLPAGIKPLHYGAALTITPGSDSFTGKIHIALQLAQPATEIVLHAKELLISSVMPAPREIRPGANDLLTLVYETPIAAGKVQLDIEYTGAISRILTDGAFQQMHAGDWYVFTKFEPITARRVFPCFDEPAFKVPWQLSLDVPAALKAFSNTPIESEQPPAEGRKLVRFKETKPLPSYLLAFAVGPFDVLDTAPVGRNHVPSRIVVPKGRVAEAEYAVSVTPQLIGMLENYFGTPYPYEKLDQVVVPLTTAWGAMENAGMIAYGDFFLAPKSQDSDQRHRQLALTMEHEMSHQWFGDLVTMQWWDDLWLNEAFASWISEKLVAKWRPEWDIAERNAASGEVFRADSLASARKIRQPIEAAGDIGGAFDGITYGKGQDVIAMFENYIGEESFERGVQRYLGAHAFGNATSGDLLSALDRVAPGSDVGQAFASYLNQIGFPLVDVNLDCESKEIRLVQQRLVAKGSTSKENSTWDVPLCFKWEGGSRCLLLKTASQSYSFKTLGIKAKSCPGWIFADSGATAYYGVTYDAAAGGQLAGAGTALNRAEKSAFLRNVGLLFSSGLGDLRQELETAAVFSTAQDPNLVRQSAGILGSARDLTPPHLASAYQNKIRALYGAQAVQLTWRPRDSDTPAVRSLRNQILPLVAVDGKDAALAAEARLLADEWLKDRSTLEAEVVPGVLSAAAAAGGQEFFNQLAQALRTSTVQRERLWIIAGLASFREPQIAESALQLIGEPGIEPREASRLLFASNAATRETVWRYVQQNFERLNSMLPSARGVPFAVRLPTSANGFCDNAHATAVESFFSGRLRNMPGGPRSLAQSIESIRLCAAQSEAATPAMEAFLRP